MTEPERSQSSNGGHRRKRFLSPSQKYEIWIGLLRGEYTMIEAAERAGIGRSTIMRVRQVAKQGALEALASSTLDPPVGMRKLPELASRRGLVDATLRLLTRTRALGRSASAGYAGY